MEEDGLSDEQVIEAPFFFMLSMQNLAFENRFGMAFENKIT